MEGSGREAPCRAALSDSESFKFPASPGRCGSQGERTANRFRATIYPGPGTRTLWQGGTAHRGSTGVELGRGPGDAPPIIMTRAPVHTPRRGQSAMPA